MIIMLSHINFNSKGFINRRTFFLSNTMGFAGWKSEIFAKASSLKNKGLSCILLFLRGGPSQIETFDPKPGTPNGGPTRKIATSVPGVFIAEGWPFTAKVMKHISLVRSITNNVAEHSRAVYQLHTGYIPRAGVNYPSIGSIVSKEFENLHRELPSFVSIGSPNGTIGAGFLGMTFAPFMVNDPDKMPHNVVTPRKIDEGRFLRRLSLLKDLENKYAESGAKARVEDHKDIYINAANLIKSSKLKCFDISKENEKTQETYGKTYFGKACLLARRLIEHGVTFVEVESENWDTHYAHFDRIKPLNAAADQGFSALVEDLRQKGILDKTLVVMMGEFGRSPVINKNTGRDHFPKAFSIAIAGAGIKKGFVYGATNSDGTEIKDNPVTIGDLFCTFYKALNIDPTKENYGPLDRPIRIVDKGKIVKQLFS